MKLSTKVKIFLKRMRGDYSGNTDLEKLKKMGLSVGENFNMQSGCIIDPNHCFLITIGDNVTLGSRVHILAHDGSTSKHLGCTKIGLVEIGDNTFIGTETTILPNIKIGKNVIVGANSLVSKDIPDNCVYAGNPARFICTLEEYIEKQKMLIDEKPVFERKYRIEKNMTQEMKEEMINKLKEARHGFLK